MAIGIRQRGTNFHGVDRVVFLMEVLGENLFSSVFQLLEAACIL